MAYKITTTGTLNPVVFNDLGGRSFAHPTVAYDLELEYTADEISASADVSAAIVSGHITVEDAFGNPVTESPAPMPITTYDTNEDGIVDVASGVDDGAGGTVSGADVKAASDHVTSDGTDHSDVVDNNTHRGTVTGNPHAVTAAETGAEPADATIMKEGENISLLNNDAGYQDASAVGGLITTHAGNADAHHAESHTVASHNDTTATGSELDELTDASSTVLHNHTHANATGQTVDDHHNQQHALSGVDHTGDLLYTQIDDIVSTTGAGSATAIARSDHAHTGSDGTPNLNAGDVGMGVDDFFVPMAQAMNDTVGYYGTATVLANGNINISFIVPFDFASIVTAHIVCIPSATNAAADIDLYSDYAAAGEAYNANSESNLTITFAFVADQMTALDVSSVLTGISADDSVGIEINHNSIGGTVDYLGIHVQYNRILS